MTKEKIYINPANPTNLNEFTNLSKEERDEITFIAFIISEFAASYKMNTQKAYQYLKKYGGIDYLRECWWALHVDNPFWAVRDMFEVCRQNGGMT